MDFKKNFSFKKFDQEFCETFLKVKVDTIFSDQEFIEGLLNPEYPVIYENDYLIVKLKSWLGAVGIEGELSLVLAPVDKDLDDYWEYSRLAGEWDVWAFLYFQYVINPTLEVTINLNYLTGNFFNSDFGHYHTFQIGFHNYNDASKTELIDAMSSNPTLIEYPDEKEDGFDYARYDLNLATQMFVDVLRTKWTFEVIPNPIIVN